MKIHLSHLLSFACHNTLLQSFGGVLLIRNNIKQRASFVNQKERLVHIHKSVFHGNGTHLCSLVQVIQLREPLFHLRGVFSRIQQFPLLGY